MQVLQWIFKVSQDQKPAKDNDHREEERASKRGEKIKSKEVVCQKQKGVAKKARKPEKTSLDCKNLRYLALLIRSRGKSRAYFINQKTLNSLNHRQQQHYYIHSIMKKKKEDGVGNNKVLPIGNSTSSSSSSSISRTDDDDDDQKQRGPSDRKKGRVKGEQNYNNKPKNFSRMKELLRWAAASKSEKGEKFGRKGLHMRRQSATIRSGGFDEELISNDYSSNMSLRWEVESRSTTCSDYDQFTPKTGQWITTDDEFVVLEL